jgi:hypothetical protein
VKGQLLAAEVLYSFRSGGFGGIFNNIDGTIDRENGDDIITEVLS